MRSDAGTAGTGTRGTPPSPASIDAPRRAELTGVPRRGRVGTRARRLMLAMMDVCIGASTVALVGLLTHSLSPVRVAATTLALIACLYIGGLYDEALPSDPAEALGQLLFVSVGLTATLAVLGVIVPDLRLSLAEMTWRVVAVLTVFPVWRLAYRSIATVGDVPTVAVIIGSGHLATQLAVRLRSYAGFTLAGTIPDRRPDRWQADTLEMLRARGWPRVPAKAILAMPHSPSTAERASLAAIRRAGVRTALAVDLVQAQEEKIPLDLLGTADIEPWLKQGAAVHAGSRRIKRLIDVSGSLLLALALGPIALATGIIFVLFNPGPLFYRQTRVGKDGIPFSILKLRTMRTDAEKLTGAVWSPGADPRVPRIGRFLRRSRLDELPQVWNILRGEMSLIGPRPERPEFTTLLESEIPQFDHRHSVLPGLTGWAQVRYPYGASVVDARRKLEFDLYYVRHWSLWFDARILLRTVGVILLGRGGR